MPRFRPRFSLRWLLLFTAIVASVLGAVVYRRRALKPDLSITAEDVAWAADYHIWKFDLTDVGTIYGLQIMVIEDSGTTTRKICGGPMSGGSPLDTSKYPVVMITMKRTDETVRGKLAYGPGATYFEEKDVFRTKNMTIDHDPKLVRDFYLLGWDSDGDVDPFHPFEGKPNKLALELLRSPAP